MATSDCGECCGLYVPGDWCVCNQGEDPENQYVVPLDDFGGATDPITTSIDGVCYEFDPADARAATPGDEIVEIGEQFEDCEDCCGDVIPGIWCTCNDGDDPQTSLVIPADSISQDTVSVINGACYLFALVNARPQQQGDTTVQLGTEYPSCQSCCDDQDPEVPDCCTTHPRVCYWRSGARIVISGSVVHFQTITCAGSGDTWVDVTHNINFPGPVGFDQPLSECEGSSASALFLPQVDVPYDRFCLGNPDIDQVTQGYGVNVTHAIPLVADPDSDFQCDIDIYGAGVQVTLPTILVSDGSVVGGIPTIMQMRRNGPAFGATPDIGGTFPVGAGVTIVDRCAMTFQYSWSATDQRNYPAYSIQWGSTGSISVTVEGFGHCDGSRFSGAAVTRRVPEISEGLGDLIKRGIDYATRGKLKGCQGCESRRQLLNKVPIPRLRRRPE